MMFVKCPLCGRDESRPYITAPDCYRPEDIYTIVECVCGMKYLNPRPNDDELMGTYDNVGCWAGKETGITSWLQYIDGYRRERYKLRVLRRLGVMGDIMDIGCGNGVFLSLAQRMGFSVRGVDAHSEAVKSAAQRGINVEHRDFMTMPADNTYDVVTAWALLEHVPYPKAVLNKMVRLTKPGGYVIIFVPRTDSWQVDHFGSKWYGWQLPRHLNHFRGRDIINMLRDESLGIVDIMSCGIGYENGILTRSLLPSLNMAKLRATKEHKITRYLWKGLEVLAEICLMPISAYIILTGRYSMMVVAARRANGTLTED